MFIRKTNTLINRFGSLLILLAITRIAIGAEYHVSVKGNDINKGSLKAPFKTISAAAQVAKPGDTITVHQGTYRERINPPRGGISDTKRIIYQAASREVVKIKGSEQITGWEKVKNDTWKVKIENKFFGKFNPFNDVLSGPWFYPEGKPTGKEKISNPTKNHTGALYLNDQWIEEAKNLENVLQSVKSKPVWFAKVTDTHTTIWAQFPNADPNKELTEINARQTVFFPEKPGINYITVRGFILSHAATPWAPPTASKQMGLIGPHWSKGWIIEDNVIKHAMTVGVQLGTKDLGEFLGNYKGMLDIYNHASKSGEWSKEKVGGHIIRRNHIFECGAAGINGNMGGAFCLIEDNIIHDIHWEKRWSGLEQGGIKLHGAIDVIIRNNVVFRTMGKARAIWLDWLGQGAVIEGNICFDNRVVDLFLEVNHGPALVANNVFLSRASVHSTSRGSAFVNNYFAGKVNVARTSRATPFTEPHSTKIIGKRKCDPLDDRYLNNIFAKPGPVLERSFRVEESEMPSFPFVMEHNFYINNAQPSVHEKNPIFIKDTAKPFVLEKNKDSYILKWNIKNPWLTKIRCEVVRSKRLGLTHVGKLPFEMPDGSPIVVDQDMFGMKRNAKNTMPGPIEKPGKGSIDLKKRIKK
jgi:alpha-N-arabinofuranosidase